MREWIVSGQASYILFLGFLMAAAFQDLREKQVQLWIFAVFGLAALGLHGFRWMLSSMGGVNGMGSLGSMDGVDGVGGMTGMGRVLWIWGRWAAGCLPGIALLGLGRLSRGGIGVGDGLFFLMSGLMLRLEENLLVLCAGILLSGLFSLAVLVRRQLKGERISGGRGGEEGEGGSSPVTIPFLPFVAVPGIWLALGQIWPGLG